MNLLQTNWKTVDGWRMFARLQPEMAPPGRLPVVFVHGLSMSSLYMARLVRQLAPHFPVYAPDLPGYGRSQKPFHPLPLARLASILHNWMEQCGLERAALVGNSMGCQIIAHVCQQYPQQVEKIVLIGPTIDRHARSRFWQIWRGARNLRYEPLDFYGIMLLDYTRAGPRATMEALGIAIRDPLEDYLPHITVPALVVRGQHDTIVSQLWAEEVAALLPQGRLVVQPKAAHVANYDQAAGVAGFIQEFLATPLVPSASA